MQTLISTQTHNSAIQVSTATLNAIARASVLLSTINCKGQDNGYNPIYR